MRGVVKKLAGLHVVLLDFWCLDNRFVRIIEVRVTISSAFCYVCTSCRFPESSSQPCRGG